MNIFGKRPILVFIVGIMLGLMLSHGWVTAAPDPVADSVSGKTWLSDGDRLRAQWLNGNFQALFNWANGGITEANLATSTSIPISKLALSSSSLSLTALDYTNGVRREVHIASAGQTLFNLTNSYLTGQNRAEVFINGIRQTSDDFTETSSKSVTLDTAMLASWQVEFVLH